MTAPEPQQNGDKILSPTFQILVPTQYAYPAKKFEHISSNLVLSERSVVKLTGASAHELSLVGVYHYVQ
jgi:hypothetical protein